MTQKERMCAGQLYRVDESLAQEQRRTRMLLHQFNNEPDPDARQPLLRQLLGAMGAGSYIEPPLHCDYGSNLFVGERFYANFSLIALDQCPIRIGDDVMLGPRVSLLSAAHPLDAAVRAQLLEYGRPITIGSHVWVGGDVTILGGVTIGDNTVIGAGSVVTRDLPANVVAAGNPCRVLRPLTDADRSYWQQEAAQWQP